MNYFLQTFVNYFKFTTIQISQKSLITSDFLKETQLPFNIIKLIYQTRYFMADGEARGHIFSQVRPFYERAVGDLVRSMHKSLWV